MAELYQLQEQEIPEAMTHLQQSHTNLKGVADYCEAHYIQAADAEKRPALEETRRYTTQALASVAYQINTLATSFLSLLDLQANQLVEMESSINHLAQTVSIHKEKVARREIGVLTTNKSFYRPVGVKSPGIIFPEQQEKPVKYMRKPIDFTILDTVGQGGVRIQQVQRAPAQRAESVSSASNSVHSHNSNSKVPPSIATLQGTIGRTGRSHYAPGMNTGMRPGAGPIAPPVAPPTVPSHYFSAQQLQMAQQQGAPINVANGVYGTPGIQPPPPGGSAAGQHMYNGDSMSPPPPLSPPLPPVPTADELDMSHSMPPPPPPVGDFPSPDYETNDSLDQFNEGNRISAPPPPPPNLMGHAGRHSEMEDPWAPATYMEKVIAIFDYEPVNDDELRFKENTLIYVIKKNSDGWWEGVMESDGRPVTGLFPENYVESLM